MFDSLKSLGQLAPLLARAKEIQGKMGEFQQRLVNLRATGTAGGGMVTATANGIMEIVELQFSPDAPRQDGELLADLTRAAVNQALTNVRAEIQKQVREITGNLDLSAFQHLLGAGP